MVLAAPQAPMWSARSSWWRGAPAGGAGSVCGRPVGLWPAGAGVRIVSLGLEVAEVGRFGCRGISSRRLRRMMRSWAPIRPGSIS